MSFRLESPYVTLLLWSFLPTLVANWLQSLYYRLRYGGRKPLPGTPKFARDAIRIYVFVVLSYLAYSLVNIVWSMTPSHYAVLGLSPAAEDFTDRSLRASFRKLSLVYHPDKSSGDPIVADKFMHVRAAYEVLQNPVRRFAYDRYGDDVANCKHCKTKSDYFGVALESYELVYAVTASMLVALNVVGKGQYGKYWRFVGTLFLAGLELAMLTRPRNPIPLYFLSRYLTTHQQVQLLHNVVVTFFIALSQVGPILFTQQDEDEDGELRPLLDRLEKLQQGVNTQSIQSFVTLFAPFRDDPALEAVLRREMAKITVEAKLSNDPELAASRQRVKQKLSKNK